MKNLALTVLGSIVLALGIYSCTSEDSTSVNDSTAAFRISNVETGSGRVHNEVLVDIYNYLQDNRADRTNSSELAHAFFGQERYGGERTAEFYRNYLEGRYDDLRFSENIEINIQELENRVNGIIFNQKADIVKVIETFKPITKLNDQEVYVWNNYVEVYKYSAMYWFDNAESWTTFSNNPIEGDRATLRSGFWRKFWNCVKADARGAIAVISEGSLDIIEIGVGAAVGTVREIIGRE